MACNLGEAVAAMGFEKGVQEAQLKDIRNVMKNLKLTAEQAMDALRVPEDERQKYKDML